jgi:hypothetical protein
MPELDVALDFLLLVAGKKSSMVELLLFSCPTLVLPLPLLTFFFELLLDMVSYCISNIQESKNALLWDAGDVLVSALASFVLMCNALHWLAEVTTTAKGSS